MYTGEDQGDRLGRGLAAVGDVNDDGIDDVAVGAYENVVGSETTGSVFVFDSALSMKDVSSTSGITYPETEPYASVTLDFDTASHHDNLGPDLFIAFDDESGRLYRNMGHADGILTFANVGTDGFAAGDGPISGHRGAAVADYDNDGDIDFFISHESEPKLYENVGSSEDHFFDDVRTPSPTSPLEGVDDSWAATWGDYDRDGYVDLYVVRASDTATPTGITGEQDRLFRSRIDTEGDFENVTEQQGIGLKTGATKTITASWADVDLDGNLDLYVGCLDPGGLGGEVGTFYLNMGRGTFEDKTGAGTGPSIPPIAYATGIAWADLDRDADLDLIVSRVEPGTSPDNILTRRNDGSGRFLYGQVGGLEETAKMRGAIPVDYDLNGFVDVLGAPESAEQAPLHAAYEIAGAVTFVERGERIGLTSGVAGGLSVYDHDGDGDLEAYIGRTHTDELKTDYFFEAGRNTDQSKPAATWLGVKLEATAGGNNRSAIGAKVKATVPASGTPKFEMLREVGSSAGRGGQESLIQRFGFGELQDSVKITVTWPDGYSESKTYTIDNTDPDLKLNGIRSFVETAHAPSVRSSTLELLFQPKTGQVVDWIIRWETDYNSDPGTLEVKVSKTRGTGPTCYQPPTDPGENYLTLDASMGTVETSVTPLADDGYLNEIRWKNRPCVAGCEYKAFDPVCKMGTKTSASGASDTTTLPACLQ
jgi:hypothetical protein